MTSTINEATTSSLGPGELTELVRGNEKLFLDRLLPLVRRQNISLDLRRVVRIDAAGLAALIELYCAARDAGRVFSIRNPSAHVAEILALVGLDKAFLSRNADPFLYPVISRQESAA
jgi:anti-anti-sigma regulatory factor